MSDAIPVRRRVTQPSGGRSLTKQADAGDADINVIVRRARQAGMLPPGRGTPRYGDFTGVQSFQAALDQVMQARAEFMELPARVRQACGNDVGVFLDVIYNGSEEQREHLRELGLDPRRVPEVPAEPAPAPAPGSAEGDAPAGGQPAS